ncbi:FUSC family protein [Janibacter alittae]|uniref:FUSC family protein n=1 Tax=Janibacter alittae TaxID=3115209 RepID=A0ABZ2MFX4_9MICO
MTEEFAVSKPALPVARLSALAALVIAPVVVLSASPWSANSSLWYLGMLPAVMGLFSSPRLALGAAFLTPTWMGLGLLLQGLPVAGALYMAAIGAAVGLSALRGWHVMGAFAGPLAAYALIGAPDVAVSFSVVPAGSTLGAGLALMGFVAAGGLWTTVIGRQVTAIIPLNPPPDVPLRAAGYFAGALALLIGIATYVEMQWLDAPNAWRVVLTFFVVVQPYYAATSHRVVARVVGTLAGAVLAVIVAEALTNEPVLITIVALALTAAAPWANLTRPYWVFVLFLTPAIVLQTAGGTEAIVRGAFERALFTVVGATAAIVVLTIGHQLIARRSRRSLGQVPDAGGGRMGVGPP